MPRISLGDLNKYGSSGGGTSYFKLANDKDVASVRFMITDTDDLNEYIYVVHDVQVGEYKKSVNCLREYNDPVDDCPFCAAGKPLSTKLFLPLYDTTDDSVKIWQRGKTFISKMSSLCSRYPNLVSHTFDVERNGKANDQKTTYELYETDKDDTELDDLPEIPEILGRYVLDKSAEEMEFYLESNEFTPADGDDMVVRRRGKSDADAEDDEDDVDERPRRRPDKASRRDEERSRRTPAKDRERRSTRKEDKF